MKESGIVYVNYESTSSYSIFDDEEKHDSDVGDDADDPPLDGSTSKH